MHLEMRGLSCVAHSAVAKGCLAVATGQQGWAHLGCQRFVQRAESGCRRDGEGWSTSPPLLAGRAEGHARGSAQSAQHHPQRAQRGCLKQLVAGKETFDLHELVRVPNGTGWSVVSHGAWCCGLGASLQ